MASSFLQVISQIKNGINYFRVPLNKLNLRNMKQKKKKKNIKLLVAKSILTGNL